MSVHVSVYTNAWVWAHLYYKNMCSDQNLFETYFLFFTIAYLSLATPETSEDPPVSTFIL